MADTDNTPGTPSTTQVDGVSVPSQITINIGGGSEAQVNDFVVHDATVRMVA